MARLDWSPEAIEDIESIADYIARDSMWYARAVTTRLIEIAETIPDHPLLGRVVPEFGREEIRERIVFSYRLVYRIETQRIVILAVIHGSRLLENASH